MHVVRVQKRHEHLQHAAFLLMVLHVLKPTSGRVRMGFRYF